MVYYLVSYVDVDVFGTPLGLNTKCLTVRNNENVIL